MSRNLQHSRADDVLCAQALQQAGQPVRIKLVNTSDYLLLDLLYNPAACTNETMCKGRNVYMFISLLRHAVTCCDSNPRYNSSK